MVSMRHYKGTRRCADKCAAGPKACDTCARKLYNNIMTWRKLYVRLYIYIYMYITYMYSCSSCLLYTLKYIYIYILYMCVYTEHAHT